MEPQESRASRINGSEPSAASMLDFVRDPLERFFFKTYILIIPTIHILRIYFEYNQFSKPPEDLLDEIKILVEVFILIFITLFNYFCEETPTQLLQLFTGDKQIISCRNTFLDKPSKTRFFKRFDAQLNSNRRIALGILAAFATLTYYVLRVGGVSRIFEANSFSFYYYFFSYMIPAVVYSYFIGIALWKVAVSINRIQSIPKVFSVVAEFGHPDGANGLLSIGQISLKLIYIFIAPTIISAFIIISPLLRSLIGESIPIAEQSVVFNFSGFILIFALVGNLAVAWLVLEYHYVLVSQRNVIISQLNELSSEIISLKAKVFSLVKDNQKEKLKEHIEQIDILENLYQRMSAINLWPFNKQSLLKAWATQAFLISQLTALWNLISAQAN
ncbi:MAG: hypothetical protein F6J95_015290 [Leptolyngbya sp. SIO1E4]|nr:hypothetical protein [Leptolyngbya sp. SIO1E4]